MSAKVVQLFPDEDIPKKPAKEKAPDPYAHITTSPHFERAWTAFPQIGRLRSSKKQAFAEWKKIAPKVGKDALLSAVEKYAREDKDAKRESGPPAFHRWLNWGRWEHWLPGPEALVAAHAQRFPDEAIRAKLVLKLGEPFVISYFDRASLDGSSVVVTSATVFGKINETGVRRVLWDMYLRPELRGA